MGTRRLWANHQGAVAVIVGLLLLIFIAIVALVIDYGFGLVVRQQLHTASDAAALHATRQLGVIYEGVPDFTAQQNFVLDDAQRALILSAARNAALDNKAGGQNISINDADILIGQWEPEDRALTVTNTRPTAVEVLSRRDAAANGPISTFFASILGIDNLNLLSVLWRDGEQEIPTAALTGVGQVAEGELEIPVGISEQWFENQEVFCDQGITFHPTQDSCAGWMTYDLSPANASTLRKDILDEMLTGSFVAPEAYAGTTQFEFIGGDVASAFPQLVDLYNQNKNAAGEWETFIVVYEDADCSNPSGLTTIVGFASVVITSVDPAPALTIEGLVKCDLIQPNSRGGGTNFGTLGSIPALVK